MAPVRAAARHGLPDRSIMPLARRLVRRAAMAVAAALGMLPGAPLAAQGVIDNVASVRWDIGAQSIERLSNRISLTVLQPPPATIEFFQFSRSAGAARLRVPQTVCEGTGGTEILIPEGAFAGIATEPASIERTTTIRAGEPVIIGIASATHNLSESTVDRFSIVIATSSGDRETVVLEETAANSGYFTGLIRTAAIPPRSVQGDCTISVNPGDTLAIGAADSQSGLQAGTGTVEILIDPFGEVFDTGDASPVDGTRVTLVDADSGQPAQVFGDDGIAAFPATVVTGGTVTDAAGNVYRFPTGFYRFPFARPGRYRLIVEPPQPFAFPSRSTPADLTSLRRSDGQPFTLNAGSYGGVFVLDTPAPVRVDIPVDQPGGELRLTKTASQPEAAPGDAIQYRVSIANADPARPTGVITLTDFIPRELRLRPSTVRFQGSAITSLVSSDGRSLSVTLPALPGGGSGILSYVLEVRPDARPGTALNRALARDSRGNQSAFADAPVRVRRDEIADRMTIIGRVTSGGCGVDPRQAEPVPGVRVILEDGSYAVTDEDGRYHFEGILPGLHVVQIDDASLPAGLVAENCERNARSAGSAISRFVEGQGGSLKRVDFRARQAEPGEGRTIADAGPPPLAAIIEDDAAAAGAGRDWTGEPGEGTAWLFPAIDHNPRTRSVRIAIRHLAGHSVRLSADGKPVDAIAFDGAGKSADGRHAVSLWRGVPIGDGATMFMAEIIDANGVTVETMTRSVHFSGSPLRAALLRDRSRLIADGITRPVIAIRLTDRDGKPVRHGLVGDFGVNAPYQPAISADARQARQLAGLERARPVWRVEGDDGVAIVELEPTTTSGTLAITLPLRDENVTREQRIEAWLDPGDRPWTIVGFAAGTAGFNTLDSRAEGLGEDGDRWFSDARLALYAKGRIKGKWLLTLAYDSDKERDEARFAGTIDPDAYYTVYADRSERRFDAASVRNLYLKLERPQFYALFGDYETGFNEAELTRYNRALNGVKAEFNNGRVAASGFAADTPFRHRREEIQGNGLTGPYALSRRDLLPNSERVSIETRDRFRSDRIVEQRVLTRHIDYDIDYLAGTLRFREPVLSRSSSLDPQFIIVDYEVDGIADTAVNAGGRVSWRNAEGTLNIAASVIHDEDDATRTDIVGADLRYRPGPESEVRAEIAVSDGNAKPGSGLADTGTKTAWLVEAEHHSGKVDVLAYAREQERGFGTGQQNRAEDGTRKAGIDGRVELTPGLALTGSAYVEDFLDSSARRIVARGGVEYRADRTSLRAGVAHADDRLSDGRQATSTLIQLGASQRLFDNRLELDAQTEFGLGGSDASIDFPARHRLGAGFAVTPDIRLLGSYEIADGETIEARTARIGFDLKPWAGARIVSSVNQQTISELGNRSFAAFGLSQSLPIGKRWSVDFSLDSNRTLGGIDQSRVLNPDQPVASGGFIGDGGIISEDFTAVTAGATYRGDRWSWTGRAEFRAGGLSDRYGFTTAALRQIGEGQALAASLQWFRAEGTGGTTSETVDATLSWAHRPADSAWSWLDRLEYREDSVTGARAGVPGPIGGAPLTVSGDARSRRVINSLSVNWSPVGRTAGGDFLSRSEVSLFWGSRYAFDRFDDADIEGWSNLVGLDLRFDLGEVAAIGAAGTVRETGFGRAFAWSGGPVLTVSPFKNGNVSIGYNLIGFEDRDFEDARYTRAGPFVTVKLKFDQSSLAGLGLGR